MRYLLASTIAAFLIVCAPPVQANTAAPAEGSEFNRLLENLRQEYPAFVSVEKDGSGYSLLQAEVIVHLFDEIKKLRSENEAFRARLERVEAEENSPTGVTVVRP